jgi:hypothetical protein
VRGVLDHLALRWPEARGGRGVPKPIKLGPAPEISAEIPVMRPGYPMETREILLKADKVTVM